MQTWICLHSELKACVHSAMWGRTAPSHPSPAPQMEQFTEDLEWEVGCTGWSMHASDSNPTAGGISIPMLQRGNWSLKRFNKEYWPLISFLPFSLLVAEHWGLIETHGLPARGYISQHNLWQDKGHVTHSGQWAVRGSYACFPNSPLCHCLECGVVVSQLLNHADKDDNWAG